MEVLRVVEQEEELHILEEQKVEPQVVPLTLIHLLLDLAIMAVITQEVLVQLMEQVVEVVLVLLEQVEHYQLAVDMVDRVFNFPVHLGILSPPLDIQVLDLVIIGLQEVVEVESTLVIQIPLREHLVRVVDLVDPTLVQVMQVQLLHMILLDHTQMRIEGIQLKQTLVLEEVVPMEENLLIVDLMEAMVVLVSSSLHILPK